MVLLTLTFRSDSTRMRTVGTITTQPRSNEDANEPANDGLMALPELVMPAMP